MNDIDHMIAVMQAAKEGKAIQSRYRPSQDIDVCWRYAPEPGWDWATYDYRIKPAEPRRVWLNWYPDLGRLSYDWHDSREEAATFACSEGMQQIEFVEVVK